MRHDNCEPQAPHEVLPSVGYAAPTMAEPEEPGNDGVSSAQVDFATLSDPELRDEIYRLARREREISFQRRFLHGQIELARADLERRLTADVPMALSPKEIAEMERVLAPERDGG